MRKTAWTVYLWPGLPQLWLDGAVSGLMMAVGCGVLLNLLLLSSLVWSELLTVAQLRAGWVAAGSLWLIAAVVSARGQRRRATLAQAPAVGDLFQAAVSEYLRGHWYEAETLLNRLLAANAGDVEARLMSATLLRRTRRYAEAKAQLKVLERLDGAAKWREEVAQEWQSLSQSQSGLGNWLNVPESAAAVPRPQARAA
jgi:hypothetical protein